jgi:hypothetical protein
MTAFNAEAEALAQRQLQAALSDALADAAGLQVMPMAAVCGPQDTQKDS